MHVLVVGGAGYIGSHMCKLLVDAGHGVTVYDNLSTGHREAVKWGDLVEAELSNAPRLLETFRRSRFDAVLHFAAASIVGDSVAHPLRYYKNNFADVLTLLEAMRQCDVGHFVFSSTAAVYGEPVQDYIDEQHPLNPINPAVEAVVGRKLGIGISGRRLGDPIRLVADAGKAKSALGWLPAISGIAEIIETAWKWHRHPLY